MPLPHGSIEQSPTGLRIVIEREVEFGLEEIWNAFTTPEGLEPWVGVLRGNREAGNLRFSMVEEGKEAEPAALESSVAGHRMNWPSPRTASTARGTSGSNCPVRTG